MSSPTPGSPVNGSVASDSLSADDDHAAGDNTITLSDMESHAQTEGDDAEHLSSQGRLNGTAAASPPPADIPPFDWDDFEARYESALKEADGEEREILKEAKSLSKYFQAWASAASVHDDERAVKRLRTRQRFVNLSEEKMAQKQKHYEEVVRAFESALALLKSS